MPTSVITPGQIIVGAHSYLAIGAYVAARGAGTLADFGSTIGGVTLDVKTTLHEVVVDQALAPVSAVPTKRDFEMKFKLAEGTIGVLASATNANWQLAFAQAGSAVTGATPNFTLKVDPNSGEIYYQVQLIAKGLGTTKTRTVTFWRAFVKAVGSIPFKKDAEQYLDLTLGLLHESDVASGVDIFRLVET